MAKGTKGGRPKGAVGVKTTAVANRIAEDGGLLPLECMIENMRFFRAESDRAKLAADEVRTEGLHTPRAKREAQTEKAMLEKRSRGMRLLAQQCAVDAAPYMHARIQAIDLKAKNAVPVVIEFNPTDSAL